MFHKLIICSTLLLTFSLMACTKEEDDDFEIKQQKTLILGHRSTGVGVNDGFLENTLPAILEALKYADGVEADIQMSSSKTPWIYHDDLYNNLCPSSDSLLAIKGYTCLLQTPDSIIEKIRICREGVKERIYKLEDLFIALHKSQDKIASLDIKGYFDSNCLSTNNVSQVYINDLADAIYNLIIKYNLKDRVIAETSYTAVFERLKRKDRSLQCHYLVYNQLEDKINYALSQKADGLTVNIHDPSFRKKALQDAQSKGLKVQLWTIRDQYDLDRALSYQPFAIQLSNLNLLRISADSIRKAKP